MSDDQRPPTDAGTSDTSDAFDVLRAESSPVDPDTRFAGRLHQQLVDALADLDQTGAAMSNPIEPTPRPTRSTDLAAAATTNTVVPYLCVDGAAAAIDFYVAALGAVEDHRLVGDDGRIGHAEIVIGTSRLMLADEHPEVGVLAPTTRGGTSTNFTVEVDDVDAAFARAVELGATVVRPVADQFYGHRQGAIRDPFGHQWTLTRPIAGFDAASYAASSAEAGYQLVPTAHEDAPAVHQLKRHDTGDLYYFTLPVQDLGRAQRFFASVLGWTFADPQNGHVGNISAPPGALNVSDDAGARLWFVVDDIHAAVERVRAAGGTAGEPIEYASGWSVDCVDDQGTVFSLSVPSDLYRR